MVLNSLEVFHSYLNVMKVQVEDRTTSIIRFIACHEITICLLNLDEITVGGQPVKKLPSFDDIESKYH